MKVTTFDIWGTKSFGIGLELLQLRQETGAAMGAEKTAADTGALLGGESQAELSSLSPFYSREMQAQHAYDPTQLNEMLTAAGAGIGGATGAEQAALQRQAATTGNAAGATKALQEAARDKMKAGAGVSEGIAAQDVQGAQNLRQAGAAGMQGLYGENLKGQLAAMGQESSDINAATTASQTGWLQQAEGLANTGANICPAEGSMYLMADDTKLPVEELAVGDEIKGIDDEPQVREEIQSAYIDTVFVTTENGMIAHNSLIHAFALPRGGFVVAAKALGKIVSTSEGPSRVVSIEPAGKAWVFNIITNGSHTYCADGFWGLGVGDGERRVIPSTWAQINRKLAATV